MKTILTLILSCILFASLAQTPKPAPAPIIAYGPPITLVQAEKVLEAALKEANANGWTMAVAIVDTGGNLICFKRMDNTQVGSINLALGKAKTANNFKRSTKVFEDAVAAGGVGLRILSDTNIVALEGGEPILVDGKIIGAIGVSGMQSTQDVQVAKAGLKGL
jgi:glc operon protein GlcG